MRAKRKKVDPALLREFCVDVARMKQRAGELGLFVTMHNFELPLIAVGYEVAAKSSTNEKDAQIHRRAMYARLRRERQALSESMQ